MNSVNSSDSTRIAFDRSGSGPALVLVGGAYQYRAFDARTAELAALLAPHFTVYHYDRRGRGDSGDAPAYTVDRELDDIDALVKEAGGSAFLFGMSSGAVLALDAVARGSAVPRLAVYEPPVVVDDSRPAVPADHRERLTGLLAADRRGDAVELFLTEAVGVPAEVVGGMRQSPMWPGFEAVAHTLAYDGAVMDGLVSGNPLPARRWAGVTVPTLVADGGASPPWLHHAADAVAAVLPDARRRTLAGQEHAVAPSAIGPVLVDFFTG